MPPLAVVGGVFFLFGDAKKSSLAFGFTEWYSEGNGIWRESMFLSRLLSWVKEHKWQTGLIGFGLFLLPLLIVHWLYKWITPFYILQSDWDSGDLITYVAGFEAFIGTVFLGIVTAHQNDKANETNSNMLDNEIKRDKFDRRPYIHINSWCILPVNLDDDSVLQFDTLPLRNSKHQLCAIDENTYEIVLDFINVSRSYCSMIVQKLDMIYLDKPEFNTYFDRDFGDMCNSLFVIAPSQTISISFPMDKYGLFGSHDKLCHLWLKMINSIGEEFRETITFAINSSSHDPWIEVVAYD